MSFFMSFWTRSKLWILNIRSRTCSIGTFLDNWVALHLTLHHSSLSDAFSGMTHWSVKNVALQYMLEELLQSNVSSFQNKNDDLTLNGGSVISNHFKPRLISNRHVIFQLQNSTWSSPRDHVTSTSKKFQKIIKAAKNHPKILVYYRTKSI